MKCACCKQIEAIGEEIAGYQKRLTKIRDICRRQQKLSSTLSQDFHRNREALRKIHKLAGGKV